MILNESAASWEYDGPPFSPDVKPFHESLPDYNTTPLVPLPSLAKELDLKHVLLKDESDRFGLPAFKILGVSWAIYKTLLKKYDLPCEFPLHELGVVARKDGVKLVACTEGNWGRAVARMAQYLNITCIIFVPDSMDQATQNRIMSEGAEIVVVKGDYDQSLEAARVDSKNDRRLLVMDVSWEGYEEIPQVCIDFRPDELQTNSAQWVVEGYSTMLYVHFKNKAMPAFHIF